MGLIDEFKGRDSVVAFNLLYQMSKYVPGRFTEEITNGFVTDIGTHPSEAIASENAVNWR